MSRPSTVNPRMRPNRAKILCLEPIENRCLLTSGTVISVSSASGFATAASQAQDNDIIEVQAGTYDGVDVKWFANNLTIEAVGGPVIINDSNYTVGNQKGIFDVVGNNATVQGITFENAHDLTGQSKNYAGIRDDGAGLTVNDCTFTGNDDGILATPPTSGAGAVVVEYSVFSNNGYGDGYSHNMYIGHVNSFTLEFSSTTDANQGHDVKSRAYNTYLLYNFIGDSTSGTNDNASIVDLPDGGNSYLVGNVIHKVSSAGNGTIIDENVEGISDGAENPTQALVMVNNTIVNDRSAGTDVLVAGSQTSPVNLTNNLFAGVGENGTTLYLPQSGAPATTENQTNLTIPNPGFVDEATGNYQLLPTSTAIDAGTDPGSINGFSLTPTSQYVATANTEPRPTEGALDIGAYEFVPSGPPQAPTVATPAAASPSTVTGTTTTLSVLGADAGGASTLTYTWAEASGPAAASFSVNGNNAAQNTTVTFTMAGDYSFTATITNDAGLTVTSTTGTVMVDQTPTMVTLNPATATVIDGSSQQFSASVNDQFGNAITNAGVTWSSSGPGSVSTNGLYSAPTTGTGSASVTAAAGTASATATISLQAPTPSIVNTASASTSSVTGTNVNLSVLGNDVGGEASLTYTWAETSGPTGVTFLANGSNAAKNSTATFTQAGSYQFTVTIRNLEGVSVTSVTGTITVVQTPTAVTLIPNSATVAAGTSQQFTSSVTDQFGNMIMNPALTWRVSGPGIISPTGLYTVASTESGNATITVTSVTVTRTASIIIEAQTVVPTPTPTPSVPPVPVLQPTVPVIIGEQALFTRKTKHGKSVGPSILDGYALEFNTPLVSANATDLAYYKLGTIKTKKVHKKLTTTFTPISGVSVAYDSANDSVSLKFTSKQTFKTGGELIVDGGTASAIESASGGYLPANVVLMISRGGKSIGPA